MPPPEPKKFTDEELKKYGIHMATRLQQQDDRGQANWADIDDDDEDWAPEEIRWTDGTKSTIPHAEEHVPSPVAEPEPTPVLSKENKPVEKPQSPAPMPSPSVKPGVLASGKGLVLKGVPEKPTLVAKPPAPPTPVKSPWATLPPVDKASPVVTEITTSQHAQRMQPRDLGQSKNDKPLFKEIAADDFSRSSFRDGYQHPNRELFNSQSGRLEPVTDRRGPMKGDTYSRQPPPAALLQRSSHSDQPEPSAAFQTHRTSGQEAPYAARRRGSSNVSGGSGSLLQRLGRPQDQVLPPPELVTARRGSLADRSDSPASPQSFSPSVGQQSLQAHVSPSTTFATPHQVNQPDASPRTAVQGPPPSIEDDLEIQKRLMRERVEAARKRRLDEDAREEAARKERIRLKLEAMGPAPERKSAKKEGGKEEPPTSARSQIASSPNETSSQAPSFSDNPPSDNVASTTKEPNADNKSEKLPNGLRPQTLPIQHGAAGETAPPASESKQSQSQTWQPGAAGQAERLASWTASNQASSRNVWGAPNNNRSLGNGTFSLGLARVSDTYPSQVSQMPSKPGPGPIGPPAVHKSAGTSLAPIGPPKLPADTAAPSAQSTRNAWVSAVRSSDDALLVEHRTQRAEQQRELEARGLTVQDMRANIKDNWKPTKLNEDGHRIEEREKQTVVHESKAWKEGSDNRAQAGPSTSPKTPVASASTTLSTNGASKGSQQPRPSRFFPHRDIRLEEAALAAAETDRHGSPSPPPPDMHGHPAFDGDAAHPHVALPPPQIVVRLPPKSDDASEAPLQASRFAPPPPFMPPTGSRARPQLEELHFGQTQTKSGNEWQDRIDNLLRSPAKVTSAGSHGRSHVSHPLPSFITRNLNTGGDGSVTSKVMAEVWFEEQEMGSLPPIRLPTKVSDSAWTPASVPKPMPRRFFLTTATTVDQEGFFKDAFGVAYIVPIHVPGTAGTKTITIPTSRSRSNPRRSNFGARSGTRHTSGAQRGGNKPREASGSYSSEHTPSAGPSHASGHRGRGGGGYRGRSENWSRHQPSAPLQT